MKNERNVKVDLNDFEFRNKILLADGEVVTNEDSLYLILSRPDIGFGHGVFPEAYAKVAMHNGRFFKKPQKLLKCCFCKTCLLNLLK